MIEYNFTINTKHGLHTRPCTALLKVINNINTCEIYFKNNKIDKSVLELLRLGVKYAETITIKSSDHLSCEIIKKINDIVNDARDNN